MDIGYWISIWLDKSISAYMDIGYSIFIWVDKLISADMDIGYGISIWADKLISADMDIEYGISIWVDMGISANMDCSAKKEGHPDGKKRLAYLDFPILQMGLLDVEICLINSNILIL